MIARRAFLTRLLLGSTAVFWALRAEVRAQTPFPILQAFIQPIPSGFAYGYSTRRLSNTYHGPALQALKTGGATQDIGFLANGDLDVPSLAAFCGAGAGVTGWVKKWYNQDGSGNDITFGTTANAPEIFANNAVINTINGKATLTLLNASTAGGLTPSFNCIAQGAGTVSLVGNVSAGGSGNSATLPDAGNPGVWIINGGNPIDGFSLAFPQSAYNQAQPNAPCALFARTYSTGGGAAQFQQPTTASYTYGTSQIFLYRFNISDPIPNLAYCGVNSSFSIGAVQYNNAPPYQMGFGANRIAPPNSFFGELIGYNTAISFKNLNALAKNQAAYWGLSWSTVAGPAPPVVTQVTTCGSTSTSASTGSFAFSDAATQLICVVAHASRLTVSPTTLGISDSFGLSWTLQSSENIGNIGGFGAREAFWVWTAPTGGAVTTNITITNADTGGKEAVCFGVKGLANISVPFDSAGIVHNFVASGTAPTSGSYTTSQAEDLVTAFATGISDPGNAIAGWNNFADVNEGDGFSFIEAFNQYTRTKPIAGQSVTAANTTGGYMIVVPFTANNA